MNNICKECGAKFVTTKEASYCSNACNQRFNYKRKKSEGINPYQVQKSRGLLKKIAIVNTKGGKCEHCGYNKNLAALEFHHMDPSVKEFQVDLRVFSNLSNERLEEEVSKCLLLCANCHRELHNPDKNAWSI